MSQRKCRQIAVYVGLLFMALGGLGLFLVFPSTINAASSEVTWTTYTNKIFGFEVTFPSFFHVTESYKGVWWQPTQGNHDVLKRGIQIDLRLPSGGPWITIAARENDAALCCSEIAGRGPMQEGVLEGKRFCRAGYVDHAMGGRWALNVEYILSHDGVWYHIIYTGLQGGDIKDDGTVYTPKSECDVDTAVDPTVFSKMFTIFRFVNREKPK
ncbi:MAG: hypothetical protein JXA50_07000 [Deltaproteobacteria bacterium]|nr:hypothetical protein [Deltaproteobacteria bacterium]